MRLASLLVPPACLACRRGRARGALCAACEAELRRGGPLLGSPPPGLSAMVSAARNDAVARAVVVALKYRRLLPAAEAMAIRIAAVAPRPLLDASLVPVPASPLRLRLRGFDPAAELALALGRIVGRPPEFCLSRRGGGRQVGRGRKERLTRPPSIGVVAPPPPVALLVDDVMTTGATLAACARALRRAGTGEVRGVTFAREV
ncbi:MAG TPA: hypothetical protein VKA89_02240 [Solirubrobacterales bacterium]|nr:hypothetical protein [Solirubrobacterales bacterium]